MRRHLLAFLLLPCATHCSLYSRHQRQQRIPAFLIGSASGWGGSSPTREGRGGFQRQLRGSSVRGKAGDRAGIHMLRNSVEAAEEQTRGAGADALLAIEEPSRTARTARPRSAAHVARGLVASGLFGLCLLGLPLVDSSSSSSMGVIASRSITSLGAATAAQLPPPQSFGEQMQSTLPSLKTIRGVWRVREFRDKEPLCKGSAVFRGFTDDNKGVVEYTSCDGRTGKGPWRLKPAGSRNGKVLFSARWKVKGSGLNMLYRGDLVIDTDNVLGAAKGTPHPDAHIRGELLEPFTTRAGVLQERPVGTFEADLMEVLDDTQKL